MTAMRRCIAIAIRCLFAVALIAGGIGQPMASAVGDVAEASMPCHGDAGDDATQGPPSADRHADGCAPGCGCLCMSLPMLAPMAFAFPAATTPSMAAPRLLLSWHSLASSPTLRPPIA